MSTSKYTVEGQSYWENHFKQYEQSKMTRKAYCREHHVSYDRFQYWYHKLQQRKPNQRQQKKLLPVSIAIPPQQQSVTLCQLVLPDNKQLIIQDQTALDRVLAWLSTCS